MNAAIRIMAPFFAPYFARHQHAVLSARFRKALGRKRQDPPRSFYDKIFWMSESDSLGILLSEERRLEFANE